MNELSTVRAVDLSTVNPTTLETIKQTVAKDATDAELSMFLTLAGKYQLDPFARQIYFMKTGGKPTIITGRDGYLAIAQRDAGFDGLVSGTVYEGDIYEQDNEKGTVKHVHDFSQPRGAIVGAWAIAYHKHRRPAPAFVWWDEYKKPVKDKWGNTTPWGQYPSSMIEKVAEIRALKKQFGISGLVTEEEIGTEAPAQAPMEYGNTIEIPRNPAPAVPAEVVDDEPVFKRGVEAVYMDAGQILQDLLEHQGNDPTKWQQMIAVKVDALYKKTVYACTKKEMETIRDGIQLAFQRLQEAQQEVEPEVVENAPVLDENTRNAGELTFEEAEALFNGEK